MEFDLKELVARAHFDYVGPMFPQWWAQNKTKFVLPSLKNINKAMLSGGKYFQTLTLMDGKIKYTLPNEPLINLSLAKTIVETATIGTERKGTVKEYICTEDYQVTIRGVCIDLEEPDNYPGEQVRMLNEMFSLNKALDVHDNAFFTLFEIKRLVLKEIYFDEMVGEEGLQRYTIYAVQDQDFYADMKELRAFENTKQTLLT